MKSPMPRVESGFLVLVRQARTGAWLVFTHSGHRCPLMYLSKEQAASLGDAVCGTGVADMALVVEALTPVDRERIASDWTERNERDQERSRQEIAAQRKAKPPTLVGYLVCGPYAEGDLWGVSTMNGMPWIMETEGQAETVRAELEAEGRHAVIYTLVHRGQPTEVREVSQ